MFSSLNSEAHVPYVDKLVKIFMEQMWQMLVLYNTVWDIFLFS